MGSDQPVLSVPSNRLLASLPAADYRRLAPHLQSVDLKIKQGLYEAGQRIEYAWFFEQGMCSVVLVTESGSGIEVATIGKEGMTGLPLVMGVETVPYRYFMQSDGQALRMPAETLRREAAQDSPFRRLLLRYQSTVANILMQTAACNGLHVVQERCCKWILLCRDRLESDQLPLTHEFLALMLGVRRASVSDVLRPLQQDGLIHYTRGSITVVDGEGLEASSCECYRAVTREIERLYQSE